MTLGSLILAFVQDTRTQALFALIAIDVVVGIGAALRSGQFHWREMGNFYFSNILPFLLGYLLVYAISLWGIGDALGPLWGEVSATVGAAPAILHLMASIGANLQTFRTGVAPAVSVPAEAVAQVKDAAKEL